MTNTKKTFIIQEQIAWESAGVDIRRQLMGWNKQIMMAKVEFLKTRAAAGIHTHPHTQDSYVVSGEFEISIGSERTVLHAGDGFFVDPDIPHGVVCLKPGILIDAFTPYRADFLPDN